MRFQSLTYDLPKTTLLGGAALSSKGGRNYIHGSDIVPECATWLLEQGYSLNSIDFVNPLTTIGCICLVPEDVETDRDLVVAQGTATKDETSRQFAVFSTPFHRWPDRAYDEASININIGEESTRVLPTPGFTTTERVVAGMKSASQAAVPERSRWWFARLSDVNMTPQNIAENSEIEIVIDKVVVSRFVRASVFIDAKPFAAIDFVGSDK
jgi:hypothetical protein